LEQVANIGVMDEVAVTRYLKYDTKTRRGGEQYTTLFDNYSEE